MKCSKVKQKSLDVGEEQRKEVKDSLTFQLKESAAEMLVYLAPSRVCRLSPGSSSSEIFPSDIKLRRSCLFLMTELKQTRLILFEFLIIVTVSQLPQLDSDLQPQTSESDALAWGLKH